MTITHILRQKGDRIIAVSPEQTLQETAITLTTHRVGALVVVDDNGCLKGIISERDIVRHCADIGPVALSARVADVMTRTVVTATPTEHVDAVLERMTDRRIRHVPVIQQGKLVGVVSIGDLVKAKIDETLHEADALRAYIATG